MGSPNLKKTQLLFQSTIEINQNCFPVESLIDSGSKQNLINPDFVSLCNSPLQELPSAIYVAALDGSSLQTITDKAILVSFTARGNHLEEMSSLFFQHVKPQ